MADPTTEELVDLELEQYEKQLIHLDERTSLMPVSEWPKAVLDLMKHYKGEALPQLTYEQVIGISDRISKPGKAMKDSLPTICVGDGAHLENEAAGCPYVPGCPLFDADIAPIGLACPFETRMVDELFTEYMNSMNVEPSDMVEMGQVRDLVALDLIMHRITGTLGRAGLTDRNPVTVTQGITYGDGSSEDRVLYRTDPSAAAMLMDKFALRKQTILKNMLATREMKARYIKGSTNDIASLMGRISEMKKGEGSE